MKMPEGKFIATVKVGEKARLSFPREPGTFDIQPGDTLLLMADVNQGIAIVQNTDYLNFANAIFQAQEKPPEEVEK